MSAGQVGQVVWVATCSSTPPLDSVSLAGLTCPPGDAAYLVRGYIPYESAAGLVEGMTPEIDPGTWAAVFLFGAVMVPAFYMLAKPIGLLVGMMHRTLR